MGLDTFVWWHGVVEDIKDPLKLGRVRVRILGWNTEIKTGAGIMTKDLPWAMVMQPITSAAMSGLGHSPTGVLQGSWVIGFFLDGMNAQQPMVMGTYGGMQKPDKFGLARNFLPYNDLNSSRNKKNLFMDYTKGFRDPAGVYPIEGRMNECDTNRLARNENIDWTIVQKKDDSRVTCDTALYGSWTEPASPYAAQYPHNHVTESQSGHVVEIDDTPGAERLHTYHKAGTFTEVHPLGSEVHKVVGNAWDITLNDKMVYIRGNSTTTVGKTMKVKMGEHLEIEVNGDLRVLVKGNTVMETLGNYFHKIKGKVTFVSEGNMMFVAPRIDLNPAGISAETIKSILTTIRSAVARLFNKKAASKVAATVPATPVVATPAPAVPTPVSTPAPPAQPAKSTAAPTPPVTTNSGPTQTLAGETWSAVRYFTELVKDRQKYYDENKDRSIVGRIAEKKLDKAIEALEYAKSQEAKGTPIPVTRVSDKKLVINVLGKPYELNDTTGGE